MAWKAAQRTFRNWKILRGDKVMVMVGKDRGLAGTVQKVIRWNNSVLVEGRNLVKKHIRKAENNPGGIVTVESPLHVSKVSLLDPVTGAPCRVIFKYTEEGTKVRVSKGGASSGSIIPRPDILTSRITARNTSVGSKDTVAEQAHEVTYDSTMGAPGLPPVRLVDGRWQVDVMLPWAPKEYGRRKK